MRKKLLLITVLELMIISMTGCSLIDKLKGDGQVLTPPTLKETIHITSQDLKDFEKISDLVLSEKTSLSVDDLTEDEKANIARSLPESGYLDTSGTEMTKLFQDHFGKNQTVTFKDIPCFLQHEKEEEQTLFIFNKEKDKYEYNESHPGHGGGGTAFIGHEIVFDEIEVDGDTYYYRAKVLFYGEAMCYDIGPCDYGKAYKSYADAKNGTGALTDIDNNPSYSYNDTMAQFPTVDMDALISDYKDKLDTYVFVFKLEDNHYIFDNYYKA